jgi:hypothetical protein
MILVLVAVLKNIKNAVANREHQLSVYGLKPDYEFLAIYINQLWKKNLK